MCGNKSTDPRIFPIPQEISENSKISTSIVSISESPKKEEIIEISSNVKLRWNIWGPYYFLPFLSGQLFNLSSSSNSKLLNILTWFPTIILMLIYFIRKVYLFVEMFSSITLSTNFAYTSLLFFATLHTYISVMAIGNFKWTKYFQITVEKLRQASSSQNIKKASIYEFLLQIVIFGLFMGSAIFAVIENYIMFNHDLTELDNHFPRVPKNETGTFRYVIFRESMFGGNGKTLYFIDATLDIWGSFLSSCALVIYLMANRAVCREYEKFNKNLKKQLENGGIKNYSTMKAIENQLIDLLNAASFINNKAAFLLDSTLICGIYMHIIALFGIQAFRDSFKFIQTTLFVLWYFQSILMLVLSLKRPSTLRSLMRETTEMIWLDRNIWDSSKNDSSIREIAQNISNRIQSTDYASKSFTPIKASSIILTLILLLTPFFVFVLTNFKHIPSYH